MAELAIQLKLATMVDRVTSAVSHSDCTFGGVDPGAAIDSRVERLSDEGPFTSGSDVGSGQNESPRQFPLDI